MMLGQQRRLVISSDTVPVLTWLTEKILTYDRDPKKYLESYDKRTDFLTRQCEKVGVKVVPKEIPDGGFSTCYVKEQSYMTESIASYSSEQIIGDATRVLEFLGSGRLKEIIERRNYPETEDQRLGKLCEEIVSAKCKVFGTRQ